MAGPRRSVSGPVLTLALALALAQEGSAGPFGEEEGLAVPIVDFELTHANSGLGSNKAQQPKEEHKAGSARDGAAPGGGSAAAAADCLPRSHAMPPIWSKMPWLQDVWASPDGKRVRFGRRRTLKSWRI